MTNENNERRNDIGQKVLIGVILSAFGLLGGMYINDMFDEARLGKQMASDNRLSIEVNRGEIKALTAKMDVNFIAIRSDLDEIKKILRRTAPYERDKSI